MSLNWNCKAMTERGINIWCKREDGEYLNPVTEALIFATMVVGCDGRKLDTFMRRVRDYECAKGNLMHLPEPEWMERAIASNTIRADSFNKDGRISVAELRRHEGFTTNASSLTDAQWQKKLCQIIREGTNRQIIREGAK